MVIEESDFRLTSNQEDSPRFDLELLYVVNRGKKNERQEFKISAYDVMLPYAIKKIAHYRVEQKHRDEAIRLKTYFKEFTEEIDNLMKLLQNT